MDHREQTGPSREKTSKPQSTKANASQSKSSKTADGLPPEAAALPLPFVRLRARSSGALGPSALSIDCANAAFAALLGKAPEALSGTEFPPNPIPEHADNQRALCRAVACGQQPVAQFLITLSGRLYQATGYQPEADSCALVLQPAVPGENAGEIDPLTGLLNRTAFYQAAQTYLLQNSGGLSVMILMDLAVFRTVFRLFGQDGSDRLLRHMGDTLRQMQRQVGGGVCGRLEGDVFALCMPYDKQETYQWLEFLQTRLDDSPLDFQIRARFGLYLIRQPQQPVDVLCSRAEAAMQTVLPTDDVRYAHYDEHIQKEQEDRRAAWTEMEGALLDGQFALLYQPKIALDTGRIFGAEAQICWNHPQKGQIPPDVFLPVLESSGFLMQVEPVLWARACRFLRAQLDETGHALPITLRLSRMQPYNPRLCQTLERLTQQYNLTPSLLELVFSAEGDQNHMDHLEDAALALRNAGFGVALDGFGKDGFSLDLLPTLPGGLLVDLKDFPHAEQTGSRTGRIIAFLLEMTRQLGVPVTVSGVETRWQAAFLKSIGCKSAQGRHFSDPLPADVYREMAGLPGAVLPPEAAVSVGEDPLYDAVWNPDGPARALLEAAVEPAAVLEWREDMPSVLQASDTFLTLTDGSRDTLSEAGSQFWNQIPADDRKKLEALLRQADTSGETKRGHFRRILPSGQTQFLSGAARPLLKGSQWPMYYVSLRDATNQVEQEEKTVEMAEMLRRLLDVLPVGIALLELTEDQTLHVAYANEAYYQTHGASKREAAALADKGAPLLTAEGMRQMKRLCLAAAEQNAALESAYRTQSRDGAPLTLSLRVAPFPDDRGRRVFGAALLPGRSAGRPASAPIKTESFSTRLPDLPDWTEGLFSLNENASAWPDGSSGGAGRQTAKEPAAPADRPASGRSDRPAQMPKRRWESERGGRERGKLWRRLAGERDTDIQAEESGRAPLRPLEEERRDGDTVFQMRSIHRELASLVEQLPEDRPSTLFAISFDRPLWDQSARAAKEVLRDVFPKGHVLSQPSSRVYLVLLPGVSGNAARDKAEHLCAVTTVRTELPACSVGLRYIVSPLQSPALAVDQAIRAADSARALGENLYWEAKDS